MTQQKVVMEIIGKWAEIKIDEKRAAGGPISWNKNLSIEFTPRIKSEVNEESRDLIQRISKQAIEYVENNAQFGHPIPELRFQLNTDEASEMKVAPVFNDMTDGLLVTRIWISARILRQVEEEGMESENERSKMIADGQAELLVHRLHHGRSTAAPTNRSVDFAVTDVNSYNPMLIAYEHKVRSMSAVQLVDELRALAMICFQHDISPDKIAAYKVLKDHIDGVLLGVRLAPATSNLSLTFDSNDAPPHKQAFMQVIAGMSTEELIPLYTVLGSVIVHSDTFLEDVTNAREEIGELLEYRVS